MFNRIYVSVETDQRLRMLKARTSLAPNILCRMGFCLSLNEQGVPDPALFGTTQAREFNRYTLTGPWDELFFALLRERLAADALDQSLEEEQFRAHVSRGVLLLTQRLKTIADLGIMVESANAAAALETA
jgi:DNA sulfur modification protein DndE